MSDPGFERPVLPEEPTVTLPLGQVVGWIEQAMQWERHVDSAAATGAAALAPELIRPDGKPTIEFAKASLEGALQDYPGIFMKAFNDHGHTASLRRPKISPRVPEYRNTEGWENHVKKFGNKITWEEDALNGIHKFETTHLQDAAGHKDLVRFKVNTTSRGHITTVNFTLSNGAITRVSLGNGTTGHLRNSETTTFVLELAPELLVRTRETVFGKNILASLPFDTNEGLFEGNYLTERSLTWAQKELQDTLKLVPEEYRPISPTR